MTPSAPTAAAVTFDFSLNFSPCFAQHPLGLPGDLGIHAGDQAVEELDHRHLGPEPVPDRAELEADDAAADDHEMAGVELRHVPPRPGVLVAQHEKPERQEQHPLQDRQHQPGDAQHQQPQPRHLALPGGHQAACSRGRVSFRSLATNRYSTLVSRPTVPTFTPFGLWMPILAPT